MDLGVRPPFSMCYETKNTQFFFFPSLVTRPVYITLHMVLSRVTSVLSNVFGVCFRETNPGGTPNRKKRETRGELRGKIRKVGRRGLRLYEVMQVKELSKDNHQSKES